MDDEIRRKILALLDQHRIMTIATLRPDGWPEATTVGYANDGLTLYFLCCPWLRARRWWSRLSRASRDYCLGYGTRFASGRSLSSDGRESEDVPALRKRRFCGRPSSCFVVI